MSKRGRTPISAAEAAKIWSSSLEFGGASRDRTGDLKLAKLALSQLSYGPIRHVKLTKFTGAMAFAVVGRGGVEPPTSRLSGVRSNHLSYRPPACRPKGRGRREPAQAFAPSFDAAISRMKGHEDGGYVLWTGGSSSRQAEPKSGPGAFRHDP